jgi:hypothetical protein
MFMEIPIPDDSGRIRRLVRGLRRLRASGCTHRMATAPLDGIQIFPAQVHPSATESRM